MKRFLIYLFENKRMIISFILGVMFMSGITYGADQLTSEGVSYTKAGNVITVKKALDELINTSLAKIDELEEHAKVYKYAYLADVVKVGDYVAYDAGEWTSDVPIPTEYGTFGGYSKGKNKGESVACRESQAPNFQGWRVLKVDQNSKTVTLVHAGQPECYYHAYGGLSDESIKKLNNQSQNYLNFNYAQSAHAMNYEEALDITKNEDATDDDLRTTGVRYWLSTKASSGIGFWGVDTNGRLDFNNFQYVNGFRPVIELKSGMLTTGQEPDKVGNQNAWTLVLPN